MRERNKTSFITDRTGGSTISLIASFDITRERLFPLLCSPQIVEWWVRPGIFDTRQWRGEVLAGGDWQASGLGAAGPYALQGTFIIVEPPSRLSHTWAPVGAPMPPSLVDCQLEEEGPSTRLTLTHSGLANPQVFQATHLGWLSSLEALRALINRR